MYHKKWSQNTICSTKVIVLLDLLEVIERKGRNMTYGLITIGFDNKK